MPRPVIASYTILGLFALTAALCRAIEYANYWMQKPTDRMKQA